LDETPNTTTQELPEFFISRAGADAPFAEAIGRIIVNAGQRVVLQQWDFANRNFMERMHAALSSGARVIALRRFPRGDAAHRHSHRPRRLLVRGPVVDGKRHAAVFRIKRLHCCAL